MVRKLIRSIAEAVEDEFESVQIEEEDSTGRRTER